MKPYNELITSYLKLLVLTSIALASAVQSFFISTSLSLLQASLALIKSMPLVIPYANIISLILMGIYILYKQKK